MKKQRIIYNLVVVLTCLYSLSLLAEPGSGHGGRHTPHSPSGGFDQNGPEVRLDNGESFVLETFRPTNIECRQSPGRDRPNNWNGPKIVLEGGQSLKLEVYNQTLILCKSHGGFGPGPGPGPISHGPLCELNRYGGWIGININGKEIDRVLDDNLKKALEKIEQLRRANMCVSDIYRVPECTLASSGGWINVYIGNVVVDRTLDDNLRGAIEKVSLLRQYEMCQNNPNPYHLPRCGMEKSGGWLNVKIGDRLVKRVLDDNMSGAIEIMDRLRQAKLCQ